MGDAKRTAGPQAHRVGERAAGKLSREDLLEIYRLMSLARRTEEGLRDLRRESLIPGDFYRSTGNEAIAVGMAYPLKPKDLLSPSPRGLGSLLVRGITPEEIFAQFLGRRTAPSKGREGRMYIGDLRRGLVPGIGILGPQITVAVGLGLGAKLLGSGAVAAVHAGDAAANTTDFHEGLNLASVQRIPFVLVLENDLYTRSMQAVPHTRHEDFSRRARAYGVQYEGVDGNDILAVIGAVERAVGQARSGKGPSLVECRLEGPGMGVVEKANGKDGTENEASRDSDPLERLRRHLLEQGAGTGDDLLALDEDARRTVAESLRRAIAAPYPEPTDDRAGKTGRMGPTG